MEEKIECVVCKKPLPANRRALFAAEKWCHQVCFSKLEVPIGTRGFRRYSLGD